jgi:hypothetical protein
LPAHNMTLEIQHGASELSLDRGRLEIQGGCYHCFHCCGDAVDNDSSAVLCSRSAKDRNCRLFHGRLSLRDSKSMRCTVTIVEHATRDREEVGVWYVPAWISASILDGYRFQTDATVHVRHDQSNHRSPQATDLRLKPAWKIRHSECEYRMATLHIFYIYNKRAFRAVE